MANIMIRRLDDSLKSALRMQAARNGRSMEEEARELLKAGLTGRPAARLNLVDSIRRRIAPLGGIELSLPPRDAVRRAPRLAR